nr:6782_t:CDS:2 [Entrophospora candida]
MSNNGKHTISRVLHPHIYNPYKNRKTNLFRIKGSVLPNVIGSSIFITAFTTIIVVLFEQTPVKLSIPVTLITVIGLVVGLLLTYRTNTAYDRYWEGRRLWSTMVTTIRNFTRFIWVHVEDKNSTRIILEKRTAINLLVGFAVATKHYLREEDGCTYDDIRPLISNVHSKLPGFTPIAKAHDDNNNNKQSTLWDQLFHRTKKPHLTNDKEMAFVNHNLPLEITLYLSSYVHDNLSKDRISAPVATNMLNSINIMVDCLSHFERILRSPIPLAYSIHLSQTVWIYCLSLPFQLVGQAHWATIPIVFFGSVILLGIERIGAEIENPFGYDENDLPLDDFCGIIKQELDTVTSHPVPTMDDWVFNKENHPFENHDINALEAKKFSLDEVRSLLLVNNEDQQQINNTSNQDSVVTQAIERFASVEFEDRRNTIRDEQSRIQDR